MSRILSRHGNVISADFRPRTSESLNVTVEVESEILYCDQLVCLMRFRLVYQGNVIATEHITARTPH